MEHKIKKYIAQFGLTIDQLTGQEIEEVKKEIKAKEQGECFLDGFSSKAAEIYYRSLSQEKGMNHRNKRN